jgi:hypothetical protein
MYTIFSAVQRQQRKSDVMTYFGLTACSAVYYQVPHCITFGCYMGSPKPVTLKEQEIGAAFFIAHWPQK